MRGAEIELIPLPECAVGTRIRLTRVTNQGGEFLRFLSDSGLDLGRVGNVVANSREAGLVTLDFEGQQIPLGHAAASTLLVERVE